MQPRICVITYLFADTCGKERQACHIARSLLNRRQAKKLCKANGVRFVRMSIQKV